MVCSLQATPYTICGTVPVPVLPSMELAMDATRRCHAKAAQSKAKLLPVPLEQKTCDQEYYAHVGRISKCFFMVLAKSQQRSTLCFNHTVNISKLCCFLQSGDQDGWKKNTGILCRIIWFWVPAFHISQKLFLFCQGVCVPSFNKNYPARQSQVI